MKSKELLKIRELYSKGENLLEYFRNKKNSDLNDLDSILISYDFQAGTYINFTEKAQTFNFNYTNAIAKIFKSLNAKSFLEIGVGEATTILNVALKMSEDLSFYGFDISWSRIKYAEEYCKKKDARNIKLFVGDMFNAPLQDNSVDVVYTSHSIEPNGGREKDALQEIYRIARKYIILLEPCFELAKQKARERMKSHGYITELQKTIKNLGYKVLEFRLFDFAANELNPTGLTIIEKNTDSVERVESPVCCPVTKAKLNEYNDTFYCEESLLAYPKLLGIPCLLAENAIVATQFNKFKHI
jgi:ubiquinone/menaquinone biosynthesis C-methylase UbiE/uncharacterized protein YbaR (Trm112 family)